tara:strand:+ start:2771 stop:5029 length:2259 start_codon:yes stop_codon:yes gene_type:complete
MRTEDLANKLEYFFPCEKGYSANPTNEVKPSGKRVFTYYAIPHSISNQTYRNHINTVVGLTPSPLIENDKCCWGALDIDTYGMEIKKQIEIINIAKELNLTPAYSKSKGLHLYCTSKDKILARVMRNYLTYCRDWLGLDPATEIFPKQDNVSPKTDTKEKGYGNGITLPYRAFAIKPDDVACGLDVHDGKVKLLQPHFFFKMLEEKEMHEDSFKAYFDKKIEEPDLYEENKNFATGSMQDPEIQKLTGKEILDKIVKEKMSLDDDESFFDDLITLYIGKGVGNFGTDEEIINPLLKRIDPKEAEYFRSKLTKARSSLNIDDPTIARIKFMRNVVYIKQVNKYFDLSTNDEYGKDAIDFEYSRLFKKENPTTHLKKSPKRLSVENWVYDPTQYRKDNTMIKINELNYLNSYQPNNLPAIEGDISKWDGLLNHVFMGPSKYKDHFLNFHAFNLQNPGVKQRHGLVIISTEYQFGKGSLWRALQECYGINNAIAIDIKQALDKSKGYLCNSSLVLVDEMASSGKWEESQNVLNDMKRIITEKEVSSRALYNDYKIVKTCTNYMFFSNKKDALKLPKNEVRYWVYISSRPRLPQQYYTDYHKWLDNGGSKHILYDLLHRKIPEDYDPYGIAPKTPFLDSMSEAGEHPVTQIIRQMFDECEFPFREDRILIGSTELKQYLSEKKMLSNARINDISNSLELIGGKCIGQCRVEMRNTQPSKPTLYLIRRVAELGHNNPQSLADEFYKPIELKQDHTIF